MFSETEQLLLRSKMKAEIRIRRRRIRSALPASAVAHRSAQICERLQSLKQWDRAQNVLVFVSMEKEVQTQTLVEAAWAEGKRVVTTRMSSDRTHLLLYRWEPETELQDSGMGFLEPTPEAEVVEDSEIDLVIVPALAIDPRGHRIGYGKGYYDRLLPRLSRALRVGVIFDFEQAMEVPEQEGDVPVQVLITDGGIWRTDFGAQTGLEALTNSEAQADSEADNRGQGGT